MPPEAAQEWTLRPLLEETMKGTLRSWILTAGSCLAFPMTALADIPGGGGCTTATSTVDPFTAALSVAVGVGILYAMRRP